MKFTILEQEISNEVEHLLVKKILQLIPWEILEPILKDFDIKYKVEK